MRLPMRMTTLVLAVALFGALGCKGKSAQADVPAVVDAGAEPQTPAPPENSWIAFDAEHGAFVEQKGLDATRCRTTCTLKNDSVAWTLDTCIGTKDDLRFVATDCGSIAVLYPYPESEKMWTQTPVARVWGPTGLLSEQKAAQLVRDADELKKTGSRFRWLKGVMGGVGTPPRYTADGKAVEFDTVDDQTRLIPLPGVTAP